MRKQNVALTSFLLFSLVMVIFLTLGIIYGLKHGPRMDAPPVGAGAGATGGANAIGELIAGNKANKSAKEHEASAGVQGGANAPAASVSSPK